MWTNRLTLAVEIITGAESFVRHEQSTFWAGHRLSRQTTTFRRHEDADCPPYIQLFQRQFLQPLPQEFGTVRRQTYEKPTCRTLSSGGRWRQPDHGALWTLLTEPFRNNRAYFIIYVTYQFSGQRGKLTLTSSDIWANAPNIISAGTPQQNVLVDASKPHSAGMWDNPHPITLHPATT